MYLVNSNRSTVTRHCCRKLRDQNLVRLLRTFSLAVSLESTGSEVRGGRIVYSVQQLSIGDGCNATSVLFDVVVPG